MNSTSKLTRRRLLQSAVPVASAVWLSHFLPNDLLAAVLPVSAQQAAPADPIAAFRAQMGAAPIQPQKLAANLTWLSGPGGNVVVLDGADGKLVVDNFVAPAWSALKAALDAVSSSPIKHVINTHWHFDHTDNNAQLHAAGATIIAHENTKKRMSQTNELPVFNLKFPPSPPEARPEKTFPGAHKLSVNGENLAITHNPTAHTDGDIMVHFTKANILQTGDVFFSVTYPYIDGGSGGTLKGMIAACDKILAIADSNTKIIPGHGPLGGKPEVVKFREMLTTAGDRASKLKNSGKSVQDAVAAKPLADFDSTWGKGFLNSDAFVQVLYTTL